jgi:hypothetical protein
MIYISCVDDKTASFTRSLPRAWDPQASTLVEPQFQRHFIQTPITMDRPVEIADLDLGLKSTLKLIENVKLRYEKFPDVEHTRSVAAVANRIGVELQLIVKEKTAASNLKRACEQELENVRLQKLNVQEELQKATETKRMFAESEQRAKAANKKADEAKRITEELRNTYESLTNRFKERASLAADVKRTLKQLGDSNSSLSATLSNERTNDIQELNRLRIENSSMASKIKTLEMEAQNTKKIIGPSERDRAELSALRKECADLKTKDAESKGQINLLTSQLDAERRLCKRLDEATQANGKTQDDLIYPLRQLAISVAAGQLVVRETCKECPDLQSRVRELETEKVSTVNDHKEEVNNLQMLYDELKQTTAIFESKHDTCTLLAAQNGMIRKELADKTSLLQKKEEECDALAKNLPIEIEKACTSLALKLDEEKERALEHAAAKAEAARTDAVEILKGEHTVAVDYLQKHQTRKVNNLEARITVLEEKKGQLEKSNEDLERANGILRETKMPLPISPEELVTFGKKRKVVDFEGSPASKMVKTWGSYGDALSNIMKQMIPEDIKSLPQAYYEVARCFATSSGVPHFQEYIRSSREEWYCLFSIASIGIKEVDPIQGTSRQCDSCCISDLNCVQVEHKLGSIHFRIVSLAEMQGAP